MTTRFSGSQLRKSGKTCELSEIADKSSDWGRFGSAERTGKSVPTSAFEHTEEIESRIKAVIESVGGLSRASEIAGVSSDALAKWRDGKARPAFFALATLARAAGRSADWVLSGDSAQPLASRESAAFAYIPRLDVQAAAGAGALAQHEDAVEFLAFRSDWLRRVGIKPNAARVLTAKGDSMEPTIRDGDVLLLDTSINRIVDNAIYVVVYSGLVLLKRVQVKLDGSVVLSSDNTAVYDPETVAANEVDNLHIAARLMWFGRSI